MFEMHSIDIWLGTMSRYQAFRQRWLTAWSWRLMLRMAAWRLRYLALREIIAVARRFGVYRQPWFEDLLMRVWPNCKECGEPLTIHEVGYSQANCGECHQAEWLD